MLHVPAMHHTRLPSNLITTLTGTASIAPGQQQQQQQQRCPPRHPPRSPPLPLPTHRRSGLSLEQFRQEYELPNKPVVLTDVVTQWPAQKKWSNKYLRKAFAGGNVIVGNAPMAIDTFLAYQADTADEMPLYLFDKTFCDTAPQLAQEYSVPELFAEDLFSLLGEQHSCARCIPASQHLVLLLCCTAG
jgi:hypothetical protein